MRPSPTDPARVASVASPLLPKQADAFTKRENKQIRRHETNKTLKGPVPRLRLCSCKLRLPTACEVSIDHVMYEVYMRERPQASPICTPACSVACLRACMSAPPQVYVLRPSSCAAAAAAAAAAPAAAAARADADGRLRMSPPPIAPIDPVGVGEVS